MCKCLPSPNVSDIRYKESIQRRAIIGKVTWISTLFSKVKKALKMVDRMGYFEMVTSNQTQSSSRPLRTFFSMGFNFEGTRCKSLLPRSLNRAALKELRALCSNCTAEIFIS